MRKIILLTLVFFIVNATFSQSRVLIGRCEFYKDKDNRAPSRQLAIGGDIDLYHNGSFRQTQLDGAVNVWKGDGDIWIIYRNPGARRKYRFETSGRIQTCDNY